MSAEAQGVGDGDVQIHLERFVRRVVKVTFRVGFIQADGRRYNTVVQSHHTDDKLDGTSGAEGMAHLRAISKVVYLRVTPEVLLHRLRDLRARGVTMRPGQTFLDLYRERCPLYERYAHAVVDTEGRNIVQISREIRRKLRI